ncbi:MAG: hypothetical protein HY513_01115 [Candidatus Aenigmarchaeota archaeon]|nr:hypothetical protein [Candidatus Aenigmarchaeota archaeon]
MFIDKYKPKISRDIIGNNSQISQIKQWLSQWVKGQALMVIGPTGCGKSVSTEVACREAVYEPVFYYAEDEISAKALIEQSKQRSIFAKKKALIFEECSIPAALLEQSASPVIIITEDNLHKFRRKCMVVKFGKIRYDSIASFLKMICKKESLKVDEIVINQIAKMSDGDVRAALVDLEIGIGSLREHNDNIFETLKILFRTMSIDNAVIAMEKCDSEIEDWLQENVADQYDIESTARAYEYLAKADMFSARIYRRNMWSLDKYKKNIAVFGTVLSKKSQMDAKDVGSLNNRFSMYRPPYYRKQQMPLLKVANHVHASQRKAAGYMPLLKQIMKQNKSINTTLVKSMSLEEEEVEALIN